MTIRIKVVPLVIGVVVGALLAGGGYALATTQSGVIHACVNKRTRALTVPASGRCPTGTATLTWNKQGLQGAQGRTGQRGAAGASGAPGSPASVSIGSVTTGAPGSQASVTNVGSGADAKLDFTIPQGPSGQDGTDGVNTGPTAYGQVWMGSSAAQLAPGSHNLSDPAPGGLGTAYVDVEGCSSTGLSEPVITVTADDDTNDNLTGADNTANTAVAWVAHWSTVPDFPILAVEVQTTNPVNGLAVNSDFSISVNC